MENNRIIKKENYIEKLETFILKVFVSQGFKLTTNIKLDIVPENSKYNAMNFSLNNKNIVYRKANITSTRPGAFLTIWKRPNKINTNNKPISLIENELDYLFVEVQEDNKNHGIFIFPVSILIKKKIISTQNNKGKTAFRVFPPWSKDKGTVGTQVFSDSAKKSQSWQLAFFLKINKNGNINSNELNKIITTGNI